MGEKGLGFGLIAATSLTFLLTACATDTAEVPMPQAYVAPAPQRAMSVSSPPSDRCGARELRWLVGKPKSEIPVPVNLANRRVICVTCERGPAMDNRLSIYLDPDTGTVQQVGCG
jgi:hypothetical protein